MEKSKWTNLLKVLAITILVLFQTTCKKEKSDGFESLDILRKIESLEGVSVTELPPLNGYSRKFQLDITQPVDHNNPNGAKFTQRAYLTHVDESKPMVFAPNGYQSYSNSTQEIAATLQTNCLNVSHRYFLDSRPSPVNWQYLTVKQAADDHHCIVSLFKKIYNGKWISSGGSKSGLAALFHKRYYPDDVDATIAYVAPFTFGIKDERYPTYIRNIGGSDCFPKLKAVQQFVLKHRAQFLTLINSSIQSSGTTFSMDRELLLELNIMDYPFTFWQYFNETCTSIPDTATSTAAQIYSHVIRIVPISNFSDNTIAFFEPFSYQAITELGAPAYETGYLKGLIKKIDLNAIGNPNYELLAPTGISYTFNSSTMLDIYNWLQNYGDKIIYIYGKNDPWSAGAIELTGAADAIFIMQPEANHGVRISALDNPSLVYSKLESWLGIPINASRSSTIATNNEGYMFRLME